MTKKLKFSIVTAIFLLYNMYAFSTNYYSIVTTGNWSDPSSWSDIACGGAVASAYPVAGDVVTICSGNTITIDIASVACASLTLTGDLTINANALTVSGTLTGSGTITLTTGNLNIGGNNTHSGTFTHGTGTATYNGSSSQTVRGTTYYNLIINNTSGTASIDAATTITGDLTITSGTMDIGAYDISVSSSKNTNISGILSITNTTGTKTFGNINIISGGTFSNNTVSEDITINGDLFINGTISAGTGQYTFAGTSKSIYGSSGFSGINGLITGTILFDCSATSSFSSLTINSGGSLKIASQRALTISGNLVNNGGTESVYIDASPNGFSGSLITQGTISGSGTELFKTSISKNKWHCISSPISDATINGVFTDLSSNNNNCYTYDETAATNCWVPTLTGSMGVMTGYNLYYFNNKYKTYSGHFNYGSQSISVTYSSAGRKGWNLVGNPYPSAIDWEAASGWTKTNINDAIYVRNGSIYDSFVGGIGTCRYIYPGQGFFVVATANSTLGITDEVRVHKTSSSYYLKNIENTLSSNQAVLKLNLFTDSTSSVSYIRFKNTATSAFDGNLDAFRIFSDNHLFPELYSRSSNNDTLSINSFPFPLNSTIIPLGIKTGSQGNFTIKAEEIINFNDSSAIFLEDANTGVFTDLKQDTAYSFTSGITNTTNRFFLHFSNIQTLNTIATANESKFTVSQAFFIGSEIQFEIKGTKAPVIKVELFDVSGKTMYLNNYNNDGSSQQISIKNISLQSGMYLLKVTDSKEIIVKKIILINKY